jgi:hypothetical protein
MLDQVGETHGVPDAKASGTPPDVQFAGTFCVPAERRVNRIAVKLAATVVVIIACGVLAGAATWSNLNATATNPTSSFTAGTVLIGSNSSSTALLSLANGKPGSVSTGCIQVTYTGTLPASVRLYGTGGGTGLNQYLTLVVTRGTFTGTPAAGSCTGFTADSTNYITQGAGVIYNGTLASWPATSAAALSDPTTASPATWNTSAVHGYQFQVTLQTNAAGQGLTGSESFTFEADNT